MLWVIQILGEVALGFALTSYFARNKITDFALIIVSLTTGFFVSSFIRLALAQLFYFGRLNSLIISTLSILFFLYVFKKTRFLSPPFNFKVKSYVFAIIFAVWIAFIFVLFPYSVARYSSYIQLFFDLSFDLSTTESFVFGVNSHQTDMFRLHSTACIRCYLHSKYLISSHTAMLVINGLPISIAFKLDHFLLLFLAFTGITFFAMQYTRSTSKAALVIFLFYLACGPSVMKEVELYKNEHKGTGYSTNPLIRYVYGSRTNAGMTALATSVFLLALSRKGNDRILSSILIGISAAEDSKTFVFLSLFVLIYNKFDSNVFLTILASSALPLVSYRFFYFTENPISLGSVWKQQGRYPVLQFWFGKTGILLFLALALGIANVDHRRFNVFYSAAIPFFIGHFIQFSSWQPSSLDYFRLPILIFFIHFLSITPDEYLKAIMIIGFVHSIPTLSDAYNIGMKTYKLFSPDEIEAGKYIRKYLPKEAVVMAALSMQNPVQVISGRRTVTSFEKYMKALGFKPGLFGFDQECFGKDPGRKELPIIQYALENTNAETPIFLNATMRDLYWTLLKEWGEIRLYQRNQPRHVCNCNP